MSPDCRELCGFFAEIPSFLQPVLDSSSVWLLAVLSGRGRILSAIEWLLSLTSRLVQFSKDS